MIKFRDTGYVRPTHGNPDNKSFIIYCWDVYNFRDHPRCWAVRTKRDDILVMLIWESDLIKGGDNA